ncbi:MAG: FtsW/RodA/SpoVE family cell cycle protein [Bacteroidales bacterium]|jgi:cell division protein FtsW|nr:FtsW/RodA/SpoVE family cell cycle protein [Bacteroidales bacterium]
MDFFRKNFKGDANIWAIIIGLSIFSLLAVYSSTGTLAYRWRGGDTTAYILKHAAYLGVGLLATFVIHRLPYKYYARLSQLLIWLVPLALLFTLLMGVNENDATRRLQFFGITFQTSDAAKLILIMFLARTLAAKQDQIRDFQHTLLPAFIWILIVCGLILPANFSTAGLLFGTCIALLFVGRCRFWHLTGLVAVTAVAGGLAIGGLYGLNKLGVDNVLTQRAPTWVNRLTGESEHYQADQARIAVGTAGFFGRGPGNSIQRNFLPHPYSDFIFAIIIEEYGIIGGLFILALYLALLYRTVIIVRKCERTFPAFLAIGLTFSIVFQALINMMVAVGLFPVTGQPLPLISMGGTSILFTCIALGIILGISRELKEQEEKAMQKKVVPTADSSSEEDNPEKTES